MRMRDRGQASVTLHATPRQCPLKTTSVHRVPQPKSSPDLNAIEGWWRRLKDILIAQAPAEIERRPAFLKRLRRTVDRLNRTATKDGLALRANRKVRARDALRLKGARSKR